MSTDALSGDSVKRSGWLVPVDVLLVIGLGLALWEPAWLPLGFHEAMGAAVVVLVIVHVVLNREGLAAAVQRCFSPGAGARTRIGLVVGVLMVLDLLLLLLSGLVALPGSADSRLALATAAWPGLHALAAALLVVFAGVHVGLNAGVLRSVVGRFVTWPRGVWAGLLAVAVVFGAISVATTGFLTWFTMPSAGIGASAPGAYAAAGRGAGFSGGAREFPSGTFPSGAVPSGALPSGFTRGESGLSRPSGAEATPGAFGGGAGFTPGAGRERGTGAARESGGAERTPGAGGFGGAGGAYRGGAAGGAYRNGAAGAGGVARGAEAGRPGGVAVAAPSAAGKIGRGVLNVVQFACIIVLVAAITAAIGWLLGRRRSSDVTTPDAGQTGVASGVVASAAVPDAEAASASDATPDGTNLTVATLEPGETAPMAPPESDLSQAAAVVEQEAASGAQVDQAAAVVEQEAASGAQVDQTAAEQTSAEPGPNASETDGGDRQA